VISVLYSSEHAPCRLSLQDHRPAARSTRSAFARGPLACIVKEVAPLTGALPSPTSPSIGEVSSQQGPGSPSSHSTSSPTPKSARKRGVPHVYRDYTNVPDAGGFIRRKTGGVTQPFPDKLHEMLAHVDEPDVVAWLSHGRAFIVRKPKEFTTRIMPKFFRQTKLTSFQRQ
jgi:HSF-type DNA-binding